MSLIYLFLLFSLCGFASVFSLDVDRSDAPLHSSPALTLHFSRFLVIHPAYAYTHLTLTFSFATLTLHIHDSTSTFLSPGTAFPFSGTRYPYVCPCLYNHQHKPLFLSVVGKHPYSSSHLFIYQPSFLPLFRVARGLCTVGRGDFVMPQFCQPLLPAFPASLCLFSRPRELIVPGC